MEPHDQNEDDPHPRSDSPRRGEDAPDDGVPAAAPQVVATDDPAVASGPVFPHGSGGPSERTTVIETSRIRGPGEAFNPNPVVVPVESSPPPRGRDGAGGGGGTAGNSDKAPSDAKREGKGGREGGSDHLGKPGHPAQGPSLTRILLYSGVVALVCGVAGAWGYSYFFGSSKSGDEKSSGRESGSKKGSESHEDSGPGQDSDSSKRSDSDKGSQTSGKDPDKGKLTQAEAAWLAAVKELHQAQEAEKAARRSEEETRAVLDFFKRTLLSGGHSGDLAEAFWSGGQGRDISLRKALDKTEPQVADAFGDRPLGEASVREMLGMAYLSVGEPSQAVKEYERALALREAVQGASQPDTANCRNQLAVAYRLAGRTDEAGRLFDQNASSPSHAAALAVRGAMLLIQKKPAEAELKFRECLAIRQKHQPDDWTTFDAKSGLGEALLDQKKFAEAEPLLVSGYEGMKQRKDKIPAQDMPRLNKALERLVRLYDAWGKPDEAAMWRKELAASGKPTSGPS